MRLHWWIGVVIGALLLGAGHAVASPPTRASWAAAANKHCAVANAKVRRLPKIAASTLIPDIRATLRIGKVLTAQLAAIPVPVSERATVRTLMAISHGQIALLQKYVDAVDAGDLAAVKRLTTTIANDRSGDRYNAVARSLGARVCAENPDPQG
jgi:hypothetical protein